MSFMLQDSADEADALSQDGLTPGVGSNQDQSQEHESPVSADEDFLPGGRSNPVSHRHFREKRQTEGMCMTIHK